MAEGQHNLNDVEKAIMQLLFAKGTIEDTRMKDYAKELHEDLPGNGSDTSLNDMFSNINEELRDYGFEVRTVCQRIGNSRNVIQYYGIANVEDDAVAKKFGTRLDQFEVKFFSDILSKLIETKKLTTTEVTDLKHTTWNKSQTQDVLEKLQNEGWLDRDDSNLVILGPRAYLELDTHIRELIGDSQESESGEEKKDSGPADHRMQLSDVPRVFAL